jgi:ribosomal protein S6--L-glutamate ligase
VKPRFGSWGSDVFRCDSTAELADVLAAISSRSWFLREGAIVQELVPPCGYDLRVLVACDEVVGAEMRVAAPGEWRTNISLGGTHRVAIPAADAIAVARAAVASVEMDLCGVDLLPTRDGWTVIELNGAVDFTLGYSLPGRDVCEDVAAALQLAGDSGEALEPALAY